MVESRFQILSLDGGGLKGLFTASFLAEWEKNTGLRVVDQFDLIAGTSTGGIIALALGMGFPAEQVLAFYLEEGERIFPPAMLRKLKKLVVTAYSDEGLNDALNRYFGDRRLGESTARLIIPAYSAEAGEIYLFKTAHHPRLRNDFRERAVDVARATAAAPTYLAPAVRESGLQLIDGGIWANNPIMVAISEALGYLEQPVDSLAALRIGTTEEVVSASDFPHDSGGVLSASPVIDFMMRAQAQSARSMAFHILRPGRFVEVNPTVAPNEYALDKVSKELVKLGDFHYRQASAELGDQGFFDHKAEPFEPVYTLSVAPTGEAVDRSGSTSKRGAT